MIALTNGCRSWGNCHTAYTTGLRGPDLFVEHLAVHADSASNGPGSVSGSKPPAAKSKETP